MSIIIKSIRLKRGNAYRMVRQLKVRLGTDCSGTDSPVYGIKQTQLYKKGLVSVSHEWSCDISTAAQEFIALNHKPKQFFADVRKRRHTHLPHVDVYVNGLPCQQWSSLGKRLGWHDPRTAVYNELVKTLKQASIRSFILENVASLVKHDKGRTMKKVIAQLAATGFSIDYRMYESSDFGLPQKRLRVYVVGIHKSLGVQPMLPDPPSVKRPLLSSFLDMEYGKHGAKPRRSETTARSNLKGIKSILKRNGIDYRHESYVIDVDASPCYLSCEHEVCPTLTCARSSGFWITSHRRRMNAAEQFRCQGFPVEEIIPVSRRKMGRLAGNAMSVPILTHIFDYLLPLLYDA